MKDCHRCEWIFDDKEDFCPECGIENFSPLDIEEVKTDDRSKEFCGAWILVHGRAKNGKETNPPLYTKICTDDIKHKVTDKRFCRGRYVLFWESKEEKLPQLIEDTDEFRIVYHKSIFDKVVIKD